MRFLILMICLLTTATSFAENGSITTGACVDSEGEYIEKKYDLNTPTDEEFINFYHSKYEYAHIYCRLQGCYRAYNLSTREQNGLTYVTSISCMNQRELSRWSGLNFTINSYLNRHLENLKGSSRLPPLEVLTPGAPTETHRPPDRQAPAAPPVS